MLLDSRIPNPTTESEAVALARELYGLQVSALDLPGEYDDNFQLTAAGRRRFVLKVMHPARERSFVEMQIDALQHLAKNLPRCELPRVIPASDGRRFTATAGGSGRQRFVWMLSYVEGATLAQANPHAPELLESVGQLLGEIDGALAAFDHPAAHRELQWDSARAAWIAAHLDNLASDAKRKLLEKFLALYQAEVFPVLPQMRRSVIYGDANDHNVLVAASWPQPRRAKSVIDFGDMHRSITVSEPAIASAYAMLGKSDPLSAAASVVAGYHRAYPLQQSEIAILFPLIAMRLAVSVVISARRKQLRPDDSYMTVSEAPAWQALERLDKINPRFAHYAFREACSFAPDRKSAAVSAELRKNALIAAPLLEADQRHAPVHVFDLSTSSSFLGANPRNAECAALSAAMDAELRRVDAAMGIGRYDEPRLLYSSPLFRPSENPVQESRTIHLGLDLFARPGMPVHAPLAATVEAFANNAQHLDYGPVIILKHAASAGSKGPGGAADAAESFYTLYGHLTTDSLKGLKIGQPIHAGDKFAAIGSSQENGGWPPHLHFQIITDLLGLGTDFPGVAPASQRNIWKSLSPDPNLLLNIPGKYFPSPEQTRDETRLARKNSLGANLSLSYDRPLKIVRGWKQYLYDDTGRAYLDVYNNVPLVGHSHPRVVRAAQEQLALLNTNTRYLHDHATRYAERLTQLLPAPLSVCFFVNSGSEANELALRLARTHTRREDIIVLDHAYHGHTSTLIDISPYKFNGPGGSGRKPWVHVAPLPDDYRGLYRRDDPDAGEKYAQTVARIILQAQAAKTEVAAFIAETLPSVGGQIVFPKNYLAETYKHVRAAGGVCIADEVQVGFGRLGTNFWGFETQGVVPDIVVLGKPIGNAFPLAAVITKPEIAASFANGMEFFSTFGGNPVAGAAGLAVLDVLRDERLQENALYVGNRLKKSLQALQEKYLLIGDVRGSGLFLGVDLVLNRETRAPAPHQAGYIVNRLRDRGILTGTDGPHHNVLKLRPPLIFTNEDAALFVATFEEVLGEDPAQPDSMLAE
jgi:4-aminobutyrate aminotransferase-like enzyme/Ser/Thr protein kinase RdoA (MazF antagonist)